jgi:two-component system CheB/CheR fusion protein
MDGCEVARQIRQLPGMATALLVAITGYGQQSEMQRCKEAGIDCHFLKPVDPAELKQLLAKTENHGSEQFAK